MDSIGEYILKTTCLLALFLGVYRLCLRKETFYTFNRFFLLAGLALSLVLPFISLHYTLEIAAPEIPFPTQPADAGEAVARQASGVGSGGWREGWPVLYLLGAVAVFAVRLVGISRIGSVIRKSGYRACRRYNMVESAAVKSSFSFFRFVFVPSDLVDGHTRNCILKHEEAHISQYHWIDLLFTTGLTILWWYNPLIWLYGRAIRENHEFLADQAVVDRFDRKEYQAILVNQWLKVPVFPLTNPFNYSNQLKRIIMMKKNVSNPAKKYLSLLVAPGLALFLFAFAEPVYVYSQAQQKPFVLHGTKGDPLYIVDGVRQASIDDVDPGNIISISVYKDEKAKEMYGDDAKNGVLCIFTKTGRAVYLKEQGFDISGTVKDETGKPLGNASVSIAFTDAEQAAVNASGAYTLRAADGDRVAVRAGGYVPLDFEVKKGETVYPATLKQLKAGAEVDNSLMKSYPPDEKQKIEEQLRGILKGILNASDLVNIDFLIDTKGAMVVNRLQVVRGDASLEGKIKDALKRFPKVTPPTLSDVPVKMVYTNYVLRVR